MLQVIIHAHLLPVYRRVGQTLQQAQDFGLLDVGVRRDEVEVRVMLDTGVIGA